MSRRINDFFLEEDFENFESIKKRKKGELNPKKQKKNSKEKDIFIKSKRVQKEMGYS